jgi:hypothetical protein
MSPLSAVVNWSVVVEGGGSDLGHVNFAHVLVVFGIGCWGSQVSGFFAIHGILVLL